MSPKGKQARQSQRKKAQQRLKLLELNEEIEDSETTDAVNNATDQIQKKRLRENESEDQQEEEGDAGSEHKSKKSSIEDSALRSEESIEHMDSTESPSPDCDEDAAGEKVTDGLPKKPPQQQAIGPIHLEQILARFDSRFDTFQKSIQATIKEEIRISSLGVQKQVKALNSKVNVVEKNISANTNEIIKINHKVANLDNLQEVIAAEVKKQVSSEVIAAAVQKQMSCKMSQMEKNLESANSEISQLKKDKSASSEVIASEVQKQVSSKMSQMEKNIEGANSEISQLKKDKSVSRSRASDSDKGVSQREFQVEKYFNRRRNLLLLGMEESGEEGDERSNIADVLHERLKIPRPKIETAFRMGATMGKSPRPLLITFSTLPQRFQVWNSKGQLNKDQERKMWLQEDLPKPLRDEMSALLRVQKKAKSLPEKYPNVKIKDFRIRILGQFYKAQELDQVPDDLKLYNIATPRSDNAVAFFGRASPLSNHHLCKIVIDKRAFTCVEHFLAWQRANKAGDKALANEVLNMKDPSEHKKVLNSLHDKTPDKWEEVVENVLLVVLRAKFKQNANLKKFLCETHPRKIGEASINATWGIGMPLNNEDVLNTGKWNAEGNRLGKALEMVREELLQEQS